jgi:hypothetical protein
MDKAEARRLLAIYSGSHDLPPEELEAHMRLLRRWVDEENHAPFPWSGRRWCWWRAEATLPWLVAALDWEENSHFGVLGCEMEMNLQFHRNPTGRINDSILWAAKQADF